MFAYPFDRPDVAETVRDSWWSSPDGRDAKDGRYCEFTDPGGSTSYIPCRALIDTLQRLERQAGKGLSRLRLVALDSFGYSEEARELFQQFEREMGAPMAAMGFARVLLGNNQPQRALEVVNSARQRGATGAALAACQARMAFANGLASDGVRLAAEALRNPPDPLWKPADHFYTWGLLHGAALAAREDPNLRQEVVGALDAICEGGCSARRALACASLAAIVGDLSASSRLANDALARVDRDDEVVAEARWMLQRAGDLADLVTRFSQPAASIDTRRAAVNTGWSLDEGSSNSTRSTWRDSEAHTITLATVDAPADTIMADVEALRSYCRQIAESHGAGLVEASVVPSQLGLAVQLIYKRLEGRAFTFTGVQIIPLSNRSVTWSVVARETGTTGVREATVTSWLMNQGMLTLEKYEQSWACDPYEPLYQGVDRSTLRYMSDDAKYDVQFPDHPLSKVRGLLRELSRSADLTLVVQRVL